MNGDQSSMPKAWIRSSLQLDYFAHGGCPHSFEVGILIHQYRKNENVLSKCLGHSLVEGIHSRLFPNQPLKSVGHATF
jgi:hypothetical protein